MNIREKVALSAYTTFQTGGLARFFVEVTDEATLREALSFASRQGLPTLLLGGGSNVLIGDGGFDGVVVRVAVDGVSFLEPSGDTMLATVGAGVSWDAFVAASVERSLWGLENLSGIPGTVGGAVVGNIGAYGREVKDSLVSVEALSADTLEKRTFAASELSFAYRSSFFKTAPGRRFVVLSATFTLSRLPQPSVEYAGLSERFASTPPTVPGVVRDAVLSVRSAKLPDWKQIPTAGSFFKNPVLSAPDAATLAARFPGVPTFPTGEGKVKVSAAWLIDKVCGLRGVRQGMVGTYPSQALVITAERGASAREVRAFAETVAGTVRERTGVSLECEVEFVGTFL